jgi:nitroreductase
MNVYDAILTKRAIRKFTDEPLPDDVILKILNAGRRAQSSKNTQPWHFVAIRDRETLRKLATTGTYMGHVAGAALCVVLVSDQLEDSWKIPFDIGQAAAYMQLAAHEFGVGSVPGTIYQPDVVRELLGLPADKRADMVLSFGYPAPGEVRPLQGQGRRALDEIVHWDKW